MISDANVLGFGKIITAISDPLYATLIVHVEYKIDALTYDFSDYVL